MGADSVSILMQRSPKALDHSLPEAYQKVMQLEGVQGVHETHFWTLCSNYYCGGLKLEVSANADAKYIVSHTQNIFRGIHVTQLFVHLDFIEHGHSANYSSQYLRQTGDNLLFQNSGHSNGSSSYHHHHGNSYGGKHSDGHGHSHHH